MPRGKPKNAVNTQSNLKGQEEQNKIEAPDISKYKFEKKPHVKIEFEKESPQKDREEPKGLWEPANWRDFLINLRNMRSNNDAPVDTMGCHMAMDENAPPKVMRYQSLIALMLSSQTKDQVTFAAMERLRERGLNIDNVLSLSDEELGKLIYPVGFWKTKVKYIKKTTQTLKEQYDGDIPDSVDKLCKLTGVGPKMAHICMQVAWNKTTGIGVDTHVHRISNRIGWVKKPTASPEDTRKALQSWLPYDLWGEVNHLMVGFGQTICQPINPMCHECLNNDICPSSGKFSRKSPNKKSPLKHNVINNTKQEFVSPVKEENTLIPPGEQKLTPRKNLLKLNEQEDPTRLCVKSEPLASTQTRKITPKKDPEIENAGNVDLIKSELSVITYPNKKRLSPKKLKNVDHKIDTIEVESDGIPGHQSDVQTITQTETNSETIIIPAVKLKKSPSKRKATMKEEIAESNPLSLDIEDTITRKTRSNKESAVTKSNNPKIKRKSPRNKT